MRPRFIFLVFVVAVLTALAMPSQAGKRSRKASKIIDRYVKAIGGERAIRDMTRLRCEGYLRRQGMQLGFTMYRARPSMSRMEASFGGRDIVQAYDGSDAWWTNPFSNAGPEDLPPALEQSVVRWMDFDGPLVGYERKGHHAEYLSDTTLPSGEAVHQIKLTLRGGDVWFCYIDRETHMELLRTYDVTFRGRTREVAARFVDYVDVGGVLLPRTIESEAADGTKFSLVFTEFEPNAEFETDIFRRPPPE